MPPRPTGDRDDDMAEISRADLREVALELREAIDERVTQSERYMQAQIGTVVDRLDTLNSKTATHGERLAEHGSRLKSVEKEVFERPRRRRNEADGADLLSPKRVGMGIAVAAASVWGLVEVLWHVGDLLKKAGVR